MFNKNTNQNPNTEKAEPMTRKQKISNIVGIVLCVLLIPILIVNCILIVKSMVSDDVPSLGGRVPLIVLTESMEPDIMAGDLIFCRVPDEEDIKNIKNGTVISFFDPAGNGTSIVTHAVYGEPFVKDGKLYFYTKGVNNNTEDRLPVSEDSIVGIYNGSRIPFVGRIAMFMQSTAGLIICIFVPLAALVAYEFLRKSKQEKSKESDIEALMAELKALKGEQSAKNEAENKEESTDTTEENQ